MSLIVDTFGRPVTIVGEVAIANLADIGTITFSISGVSFTGSTNFRIMLGYPQLLNITTGLWHDIYIENDPNSGVALLKWSDNPGVP